VPGTSKYPKALDKLAVDKGSSTNAREGKPTAGPEGDHSGHHNALAAGLNAVQSTLGVNPQGKRSSVTERMGVIESEIEAGLGELPEDIPSLGEDGTVGGPGGSPLSPSVVSGSVADKAAGRVMVIRSDGTTSGWVDPPEVNAKAWGCKGDDATDDTAAAVAALAHAESIRGKLTFPRGVYLVDLEALKTKGGGVQIEGEGKLGSTRLKARSGSGYLLTLGKEAGEPYVFENHSSGNSVRNIALDGNGRSLDGGGLRCEFQQWLHLDNLYSANFRREAFLFGESVREATFNDVYARFSGTGGDSYPQVRFLDAGATDGANNVTVVGLKSVFGAGHALQVQGNSAGGNPTRGLYFYGTMLHGPAFTTPYSTPEGYTYENQAEWRQGQHNLVVEDARTVRFEGIRMHAPSRGFAHARISQGISGAGTLNEVKLASPSFGRPNEWAELPVTAAAATDTLTTTGEPLYLGTGAIVRVSSSGSLPTGLVAATDYWVIRTSDNAVKLATTRAAALAGTAIDLTSEGSGTIKIIPRHEYVDLEFGTLLLDEKGANDATKDGLLGFVNRTGTASSLRAPDEFGVHRIYAPAAETSGVNAPVQILVEGDTNPRTALTSNGDIYMGPGNEAAERYLYRAAKGVLRTDQILTANGAAVNIGGTVAHSGSKVGLNGAAPTAKAAAIASPAAELAALKTAVDAIREAIKAIGITS
jgi:hypothetical protein